MSYFQKPKGSEEVMVNEIRPFLVVMLLPLLLATQLMAANRFRRSKDYDQSESK